MIDLSVIGVWQFHRILIMKQKANKKRNNKLASTANQNQRLIVILQNQSLVLLKF